MLCPLSGIALVSLYKRVPLCTGPASCEPDQFPLHASVAEQFLFLQIHFFRCVSTPGNVCGSFVYPKYPFTAAKSSRWRQCTAFPGLLQPNCACRVRNRIPMATKRKQSFTWQNQNILPAPMSSSLDEYSWVIETDDDWGKAADISHEKRGSSTLACVCLLKSFRMKKAKFSSAQTTSPRQSRHLGVFDAPHLQERSLSAHLSRSWSSTYRGSEDHCPAHYSEDLRVPPFMNVFWSLQNNELKKHKMIVMCDTTPFLSAKGFKAHKGRRRTCLPCGPYISRIAAPLCLVEVTTIAIMFRAPDPLIN